MYRGALSDIVSNFGRESSQDVIGGSSVVRMPSRTTWCTSGVLWALDRVGSSVVPSLHPQHDCSFPYSVSTLPAEI